MPVGSQGIRQAIAEAQARKEAYVPRNYIYFRLPNDGDSAVVRFLEQGDDFHWAYVHQMPPRQGQRFGDWEVSLDQNADGTPCPLVDFQLKRAMRGYHMVIWRNAPVYQKDPGTGRLVKDATGRYNQVGTADQLALWQTSKSVEETLLDKDVTYKGLMSRDFRVTRRGEQLATTYNIDPSDPDAGPVPMSAADRELAATKPDMKTFITPKPYEALYELVTGAKPGAQGQQPAAPTSFNPFFQGRQ
jgi:hypothetical protein